MYVKYANESIINFFWCETRSQRYEPVIAVLTRFKLIKVKYDNAVKFFLSTILISSITYTYYLCQIIDDDWSLSHFRRFVIPIKYLRNTKFSLKA